MSRIFKNMKEAVNEIERDIMEMGILVHPDSFQNINVKGNPDYDTLEVQNYTFSILDVSDKDALVGNDLQWCLQEFQERIDAYAPNPGEAWKLRQSTWEPFLVDGKMDYTYSERINLYAQLDRVIKELKENPDTRQAIIHINMAPDCCVWRKNRIPCSMYYHFMIRRGAVDVIYAMRSSDFDTHFKNDIWLADEMRKHIAKAIHKPIGIFHMNISSLHRYRNYTKKHIF